MGSNPNWDGPRSLSTILEQSLKYLSASPASAPRRQPIFWQLTSGGDLSQPPELGRGGAKQWRAFCQVMPVSLLE